MGDPRFTNPGEDPSEEDWMTTFADMVTLLLAFFVMLAAISKVDVVLYEQVAAGMAKGIGKRDVDTPVEKIRQEMKEVIKSMKVEDVVGVGTDSQGITLEFAAASFYEPGSADIREEAIPILNRVAATINADRYTGFQVEVQGHTDNTPISTPMYPSNWELSAARATRVVRFFVEAGLEPSRMRAIGLADTAPKVPNTGPYGDPLPQNQEINRRVVVRIFPR